jgi:hypothetical protein
MDGASNRERHPEKSNSYLQGIIFMNDIVRMLARNILWFLLVLWAAPVFAQQADQSADRLAGKWQGSWLEGMSTGKVFLELAPGAGQSKIELTGFPKFGPGKAPVRDVVAQGETLKFVTVRADGEKVTFDLKLNDAGSKMKGKARYEGSRMEVELVRSEE